MRALGRLGVYIRRISETLDKIIGQRRERIVRPDLFYIDLNAM